MAREAARKVRERQFRIQAAENEMTGEAPAPTPAPSSGVEFFKPRSAAEKEDANRRLMEALKKRGR
jgi:hypothetical protein